MNQEKYRIVMSQFEGRDEDGCCTYRLTFNRSLEHTGKWDGIEKGLNDYDKKESRQNAINAVIDLPWKLWYAIKSYFA